MYSSGRTNKISLDHTHNKTYKWHCDIQLHQSDRPSWWKVIRLCMPYEKYIIYSIHLYSIHAWCSIIDISCTVALMFSYSSMLFKYIYRLHNVIWPVVMTIYDGYNAPKHLVFDLEWHFVSIDILTKTNLLE